MSMVTQETTARAASVSVEMVAPTSTPAIESTIWPRTTPPNDHAIAQTASARPRGIADWSCVTTGTLTADRRAALSDSEAPAELRNTPVDHLPTHRSGETGRVSTAQVVRMGLALGAQRVDPDLRFGIQIRERRRRMLGTSGACAESIHTRNGTSRDAPAGGPPYP